MPPKSKPGGGRRLSHPASTDVDYSDGAVEFMNAMEKYKVVNERWFPTWREVYEVFRSLGYRQVGEPSSPPVFDRCPRKT